MEYLSEEQRAFYARNGYLVLEGHLPGDMVERAHAEIARLSRHAATITESADRIDLENTHTLDAPRIRRIKRPDLQMIFLPP